MKRIFCVGLGFTFAAIMAIAADVPTSSVAARIWSSYATVYRPVMYTDAYWISASCKFSISTTIKRVKKPILKLIICYERGDSARYHAEKYSITEGGKWSFNNFTSTSSFDAAAASKVQTEVESSTLRNVTVQSGRLGAVDKGGKVIAVRTELWFDGAMLCNDNPQNILLPSLGLPEDWYVKGKYPDKMQYQSN